MREVKLSDGKTIEIKALTPEQIKNLGPVGFSYIGFNPNEGIDDAEATNKYFDALFAEVKIDAVVRDYAKIFKAIIEETYGTGEQEKN